MEELVLKHSDGCIKYLSFLSRPHMSPRETISIPFYEKEDDITGNSCRGMFYFDNFRGKAVVCNLTTKQFKLLTPPNTDAFLCNSCLGYDPKSKDYKVIRNHCPDSTAEVFLLKDNCWKVISGPSDDIRMGPRCGVYLEGKCYWLVWVNKRGAGGVRHFILSFDFTHETFSRLPLPLHLRPYPLPEDHDTDYELELFDCDGCLGVVGFKTVEDYNTRVAKLFELWVFKDGLWARSFSAMLLDVERPFGLKDGRFLFLEGNSKCKHNHLMVYDWIKEELKEHEFYDVQPSRMLLFSYAENTTLLPDAKPSIFGAQTDEDPSKKVLKRCCRREKVPKRIGQSAQDVEPSSEKVLKRCSRRREKVTSSPREGDI